MVIPETTFGTLRHLVENALYDYAAAADDLDVEKVVALFGRADVRFGRESASTPTEVEELFRQRFDGAPPVRHLLGNVRISGSSDDHGPTLHASCRYIRTSLLGEPQLLSLGDYSAQFDVHGTAAVTFRQFIVSPAWARS